MKRIFKNSNDIPVSYLDLIKRKRLTKPDIESGHNKNINGRTLFTSIKKRSTEYSKLKLKLLNDQGHICCYCNNRIYLIGSTIEHIIPISKEKSLLAEYSNLLIGCNGGRIERANHNGDTDEYPLYCDANREGTLLPFTPLDIDCEAFITYSITDGRIIGMNDNAESLIEILNLDCIIIRSRRLNALSILFDDEDKLISEEELELIWDHLWKRDDKNRYQSFFYAVLFCIYSII